MKEKVKHEEEKGTETKLGYGDKEWGKEKRFKRKRQAGNSSLSGSRLKSVKIKMKFKVKHEQGNKSVLFCILPRHIHNLTPKSAVPFSFLIKTIESVITVLDLFIYLCSPDPSDKYLMCVKRLLRLLSLQKATERACVFLLSVTVSAVYDG